jgi:hypothetical protein
MGIGALASTGVGFLQSSSSLPIFIVMMATAIVGLAILLGNQRRIAETTGASAQTADI